MIDYSDFPSRVVEYPKRSGLHAGTFISRVKIEEASINSTSISFHPSSETKEVEDILINSPTQNVNRFPTQI